MKRLLIFIVLVALVFLFAFTGPAMAAPRASPITLAYMMSAPTILVEGSMIQVRSIGTFFVCFVPVAFYNTMEPSFATMEQSHDVAYNTLSWTTIMSAASRMENTFTVRVSTVLRL